MDDCSTSKTAVFRDLTDRKDVIFQGDGEFEIGLSKFGSILVESTDTEALYVPLLKISAHDTGGYTLTPSNQDLPCSINEEEVTGEISLIHGTRVSVANKTMMFIEGPVPKIRPRRLPPTPGMPLVDAPPEKPIRQPKIHVQVTSDTDEDQKWLDSSWTKLEMSSAEQIWLDSLNTPEQIGIMASSYFCKQMRNFTDARLTIAMMDDIFHLFQDVIVDSADVFMQYLSDISHALSKVPNCTQTHPMHGPAIRLLSYLLNLCIEPVSKVTLVLDLLRTFSHFDANLDTMVKLRTSGPVLGSMSVYKHVADIQVHGLDILAKIARHRPAIGGKMPLREACVEIVLNAVKLHMDNVCVCRSACRVLANLASTLVESINGWIDTETSQNEPAVAIVMTSESLLVKLFEDSIHKVQEILKCFHGDLGVHTEGRRFLYYYATLPQLQQKKNLWTSDPPGILKPARSYECLKTATHRLSFVPDTVGGSDSELDTNSEASFGELPFEPDIPIVGDIDGDFSCHLVRHLIRKTVKKRTKKFTYSDDSSSESSDEEFLRQLPAKLKSEKLPDVVLDSSLSDSDSTRVPLVSGDRIRPIIPATAGAAGRDRNTSDDQQMNATQQNFENQIEIKNISESLDISTCTRVEEETDTEQCDSEKQDKLQVVHKTVIDGCNQVITSTGGADGTAQPVIDATDGIQDSHEVVTVVMEETDGVVCNSSSRAVRASPHQAEVVDVSYLGKLVRTQIIIHVGSLVFQGDDTEVLLVIDRPIVLLLERSAAPPGLVQFAQCQYGDTMTLMDLEPAIVISVIDAVRYRAMTSGMVQSAVLSLTRGIFPTLHKSTVDTTMLIYKALFADTNLTAVLTEPEFLQTFKACFQSATERLETAHPVEEIRKNLSAIV